MTGKKAAKALGVLTMAGAILAAQGGVVFADSTTDSSTGDPIIVQFWHTRGTGPNYEVVQHEVETFNSTIGKEKNIEVQETYIGSYDDILAKTQLAVQSGEVPQVVVSGNTYVNYLIEDGVLADMALLAEKTGWDRSNMLDPFQDIAGNTDGTLYSVPYVRSTPMFYYNKTMADAKGLTAPVTVDDMADFCSALYQEGEVSGLCLYDDFGYYQAANLYQMGSAYIADDGNSCPALDDGAMLKVLSDWRSWVDAGWCEPFDVTDAGSVVSEEFSQQKLAAVITSSGMLSTMQGIADDAGFELGVCQYPTYDENNRVAMIGGGNVCIIGEGNSDEQIAASWEFVQFLMSDEEVTFNTQHTGYVPTTKSVADYDDMKTFWEENPLYKVAYDQVVTGHCQEQPYSPYLADLTTLVNNTVSLLIADQSIDAQEAVDQIKKESSSYYTGSDAGSATESETNGQN